MVSAYKLLMVKNAYTGVLYTYSIDSIDRISYTSLIHIHHILDYVRKSSSSMCLFIIYLNMYLRSSRYSENRTYNNINYDAIHLILRHLPNYTHTHTHTHTHI